MTVVMSQWCAVHGGDSDGYHLPHGGLVSVWRAGGSIGYEEEETTYCGRASGRVQNQPASTAMRMASTRLRPPVLVIALDR